jgi:ribosomal protein S1
MIALVPTQLDPFQNIGKYNPNIILTKEDKKSKLKIYCHEPYAQELYDLMSGRNGGTTSKMESKDLILNEVYKVRATHLLKADRSILTEEVNSGVSIIVPIKEYSKSIDELAAGKNNEFYVKIYHSAKDGEYIGSEKKALSVSYKQELFVHLANETSFEIKLKKLIKGGYLAIYQNEVECFVPGSHAAANVVHNFGDLLGKTLTVMVDNYDSANDLFILSYKKYVSHSMPKMITELKFDEPYTGVLTNNPYDFGIFVEIDGYYTGLIHKSEFENYDDVRKNYRVGDKISVYVKDVTTKGNQYRIVLTLDKSQVNGEKLQWQELRNKTENNSFSYTINKNKNSISIDINGESYEVQLKRNDLQENLNRYPMVKVFKVDPINKRLRFEFVEA